jgi:hypothetical protein
MKRNIASRQVCLVFQRWQTWVRHIIFPNRSNYQGGFSAVEGLLIFIIVGIIGGTGWYVMNANGKTNDTLDNAGLGTTAKASKKKQTNPPAKTDPLFDWLAYSSKTGKYSLKYPPSWATASKEGCDVDDSFILLGGDSKSVGKYCADGGGQMYISSVEGDHRADDTLKTSEWKEIVKTSITVDKVVGERQSGTAFGQEGTGVGELPDGSKQIRYTFYTNGRTYTANYIQTGSYPNVLNDFDLMVTKTLKFSAQ